jgi:hypothetical protein
MSVTKNHASKFSTKSRAALHKAIEPLESRQLLSATLTLVNPDVLPGSSRLVFNYIQNPDTSVPNAVHDKQTLEITDTGSSNLSISSMTLSGPWAFVGAPAGGYSNVTVTPSTPLTVTLEFTQRSLPAHSTNETNYTTEPNGGAYIDGSLTINSNDATTPTKTVTLAGYWQSQSANEEEPNLQTIVNSLAGYDTVIATPSQLQSESNGVDLQNNGSKPTYYGQEVTSTSWQAADPTQPVVVNELAQYYIEGLADTTYWYSTVGLSSHPLFTTGTNQGQTMLPTQSNGQLAQASFMPGGAFGFRDDNLYSTDAINIANGDSIDDGHRFRFYPMVDGSGNAVPNTWLVAVHEGTALADYQDAVYVVSNMEPSSTGTTPPAPTNLTATSVAHPVLDWTGVTYPTLAGYNVYRSTSPTGTYTKLTATPVTTTTFTDNDSTPVGTPLYYRVTAVDNTSGNESAPATATANLNAGPVALARTIDAYSGTAIQINLITGDTDGSGATILPGSVAVTTGPNHGGTVTIDSTTGVATYTAAASFSGTETFSYTVGDSNSATSAPATVTINVTSQAVIPPNAESFAATTLVNTPVTITPEVLDSTGTIITPASVLLSATSGGALTSSITTAWGTAVVNSDETITYTPNASFVGADPFFYEVTSSQGAVSTRATLDMNVGVQINTTVKGGTHAIAYLDQTGTNATISLNKGVADVYFDGDGTAAAAKHGKVTVTGSGLTINQIALSATTAASTLSIAGAHNGAVTLAGVTDSAPLGAISARTTKLAPDAGVAASAGVINLGGVRSIVLGSVTSAKIEVQTNGVTSTSLTAGAVTNSSYTSDVPVNSLNVASWANSTSSLTAESVTAPVLKSLVVAGEFDPDLNLTSTARSLFSARVAKAVNKGLWNLGGSAGPISIGSVGGLWGGITAGGTLSSVNIKTGGLPAGITAGSIGSLNVAGVLSGDVTTTGNLGSLRATQLVGATIDVGNTVASAAAATLANLGTATLKSLVLTSKLANTFSDSNIVADVIGNVVTGQVNIAGTDEGIAGHIIHALTVATPTATAHIPGKSLVTESALTSYLSSKAISLGNFAIDIL